MKLQDHRQLEDALKQFDTASRLAPQNVQFLTAREVVKAQLVFDHVQRGNLLMLENARARAAAEFRAALDLDPENQFARERLADATAEMAPALPRALPVRIADSGEIHLEPKDGRATFHYSGEVRGLYAELSAAFGVTAQFDDSVQARQVRFNVDDVDFFTALKLVCQVSKTMWAALDAHQMLIAADNTENHKQFDRMSLRTFILPPHSTPQESTDLVTTMRNMFDLTLRELGTNRGHGGSARAATHAGSVLQIDGAVEQRASAGHARYPGVSRSTTSSRAISECTSPTRSTCTTFRRRRWRGWAGRVFRT